MRGKILVTISTILFVIGIAFISQQFILTQGASDFKSFDADHKSSRIHIGDTQYSVFKTSNGIQALGMNSLSNATTTWNEANALATQHLSTLDETKRSMFSKSELPSYNAFANNRDGSNSQQLNEEVRRGNQNWWLYDTRKIQLSHEVNTPGNAVYASHMITQGKQIDNSKPASSFAYKKFNNAITNHHTIGVQNDNATIPINYALNNNYTLGNKFYEYKDTQVKSDVEKSSSSPGYTVRYNFVSYDWNSYPNSYGSIQTDQVIVRNGTGNTGGTKMRFKDLMDYNDGAISIVSELNMQNIIKQSDGRLRINVSQFFSNSSYPSRNKSIVLKGGKQYIVNLTKGYPGRWIKNCYVSIEIPSNVSIKLKRGKTSMSDRDSVPAMLTTNSWDSDIPYWVGDTPLFKGTIVNNKGGTTNADKQVLLYSGENVVYKGPISNLLDHQGRINAYAHTAYYRHTSNMPDVGGWGYVVVCHKQWATNNIAELNSVSGQQMIYIPHAISKPSLNLYLNPGFYQLKYPDTQGDYKAYLKLSEHSGSVRNLMIDAYTRQRRGEAFATPFVIPLSLNEMYGPESGMEYNMNGNRGLSLGTYSINEHLPSTILYGEKAFSYPLMTLNTQKIAYVTNSNIQTKIDPVLKETSNHIKKQSEAQVVFAFTNKLSWKTDEVHLSDYNLTSIISSDGNGVHIQGGNKKIQFKVKGMNDSLSMPHTLYVSAATEDKTGKAVYSRIGTMSDGVATLDLENIMDYKTIGSTKNIRLYIEAITPDAQMNYVSETSLPLTLDIIEPNHMSVSFPTYVALDMGKADVNIAIVDYAFFQENVPASFTPSVTSSFQSEDESFPNVIKVSDKKGKSDLKLKVIAPQEEILQGSEIGIGKTFTYKVYGDGSNGSDTLSTGLWEGLMKVHVNMKMYP